jgi:hypothetical protein
MHAVSFIARTNEKEEFIVSGTFDTCVVGIAA